MCGISGIISKQNQSISEKEIRGINDLVTHRGPDGEGFFKGENFSFGHRRLSIVDLSSAGAQPMNYLDRYTITYNGEIFNYIEIREELIKSGYSFRSQTDTEVILAAYDCWNIDSFLKFNGMWSFAIYDNQKNEIICCRDRFGIKPFYYVETGEKFVFGSEIKQCLPYVKPSVNIPILMDYLALNLNDHTDETFFKGIKTLQGSHYLRYDLSAHSYTIHKYYTIHVNKELKDRSYEENRKGFIEEFERSIKWRLRSDVPVGTCLSGGLDSSLIASVAAKQHSKVADTRFKAITAEAIDEEFNEVKYAEMVAASANLEWYVTKPSTENFWDEINTVIKLQEEPFIGPSVVMQYYVMKEAKKAGVTVLLDGQGSDESLLGYPRYMVAMMGSKDFIGKLRFIRKAEKQYGLSMLYIIKNYFYFSNPFFKRIRAKLRLRNVPSEYKRQTHWHFINQINKKHEDIHALQELEITTTEIPELLKWEDKSSMFFSIETRLPFLDWKLLEYSLSLPADHKIKDGWSKIVIRDSMKGLLPDEVAWRRKKLGFNAPVRSWLADREKMLHDINTSPFIQRLFNNQRIAPKDGYFLWRLFNIARWAEIFKVEFPD